MKLILFFLLLIPGLAGSYPLSPHEIYGTSSKSFIQEYYTRVLNFVTQHHPKIEKCLNLAAIKKQIFKFNEWGEIIDLNANILAPYLEISYQRRNPTEYQISVKVRETDSDDWGSIYSMNQAGACKKQKIHEYHTPIHNQDLKSHLFSSLIFKSYRDIVFINSFSLTFINPPLREWAILHQNQLNQMTYKLSWKNENEYTLYYP